MHEYNRFEPGQSGLGTGVSPGPGPSDPVALFQSVSDATRLRLLRLLTRDELNVQELVRLTGLSQPGVSRHLAVLRDQGWLVQRREGTWNWYRAADPDLTPAGPVLFAQVLAAAGRVEGAAADDRALALVQADRRARGRDRFAGIADRWDDLRAGYEHPDLRLGALGALAPAGLRVLDIGTGTGAMLPVFALADAWTVALDASGAMLARARARAAEQALADVRLCGGDLERLPFGDGVFDLCHGGMVLHHVEAPEAALREMARVVRPGGRVVVTAFVPHEQQWMRDELGYLRLGFAQEEIEAGLRAAGLVPGRWLRRGSLAPAGAAGASTPRLDWPDLFLASGLKPAGLRQR
jgi:SAM-dependent methyltransferase